MWQLLACMGYIVPCQKATICPIVSVIATTTSAAANISIGLAFLNFELDGLKWFFVVGVIISLSDAYLLFTHESIEYNELHMAYLSFCVLWQLWALWPLGMQE